MNKTLVRLGAVGASATLAAMAAAPAWAAPAVAQAEATAVRIAIAGNGSDSGVVRATHDGSEETREGETTPPVGVLGNQDLANFGVLQQDAVAQVQDGEGVSAACAGVAGEGGSVAQVGDSSCIFPGQPVGVTIANLDLTGAVAVQPESALGPLNEALAPVMEELVGPLTAAIAEGLAPLADTGLIGTFSTVEERCVAGPDSASAEATIVDGKLSLTIADQTIELLNLPTHPEPNTKVVTDLDTVLNLVVDAVEENLRTTLEGALAETAVLTDELQAQVVDTLVAEVSANLGPVEENLLDITLNAQSTPEAGAIEATAIDAQVLPAAAEVADASMVAVQLGNVMCGPNGVVEPEAVVEEELPEVPTVVDAGVAGDSGDRNASGAAGALLLAGVAGLIGYRRVVDGR